METVYTKSPGPYRRVESLSLLHRRGEAVVLNEAGTKIWDLLDGQRTVAEVAGELAKEHTGNPESIVAKIDQYLKTLRRLGIVASTEAECQPQFVNGNGQNHQANGGEAEQGQRDIESVTSICMTPKRDNRPARTASERIEQVYWENRFIQKMHLELTYRCNFRCVHCYNTTHAGAEKEMTTEEWYSALDQLADMGCHTVTFTGGEAFVRKDVLELLQAACEKTFSILVNTNGSMISEAVVQKLVAMRPFLHMLEISFYGATPDAHDALARRPGSYQSTLRALKLLLEANLPAMAKFITMRDNYDGIPRFKRDMQELGAMHAVSSGLLIPKTNRDEAPLVQILTDEQYRHLLETAPPPLQEEHGGVGDCRPGHVRGAITPDGGISPCEWLTDFKLGNLRQSTLREIWYSQPFQDFRHIFDEEPECHTCELRPGCARCPAQSYLETGNLQKCAPVPNHYAEMYHEYRKAHA